VTDREKLLRKLKRELRRYERLRREALDRWAGLPRITIYDRPRRSKGGRRKRKSRAVTPFPIIAQLPLPL
jgi:hypothetical protein